jgi:hypothetical protein
LADKRGGPRRYEALDMTETVTVPRAALELIIENIAYDCGPPGETYPSRALDDAMNAIHQALGSRLKRLTTRCCYADAREEPVDGELKEAVTVLVQAWAKRDMAHEAPGE